MQIINSKLLGFFVPFRCDFILGMTLQNCFGVSDTFINTGKVLFFNQISQIWRLPLVHAQSAYCARQTTNFSANGYLRHIYILASFVTWTIQIITVVFSWAHQKTPWFRQSKSCNIDVHVSSFFFWKKYIYLKFI